MSYLDIDNLYKNQDILRFRECYAMEKIDGTSAHVTFKSGRLALFAGGASYEQFVKIFDQDALTKKFEAMMLGDKSICVYGEAYGGKMQGRSKTYGDTLKFIAFEVKIGDSWLNVPDAEKIVLDLGLEFVHYKLIKTDLALIDAERDAPSEQARRNGCFANTDKYGYCPPSREGVVLRPTEELTKNNGERIICKHKRDESRETATPRKVVDPKQLQIIADAKAIAKEWVTAERLNHILTSGVVETKIENTGKVIQLMIADVLKESKNEIVDSSEARKEIGTATAIIFKDRLKEVLK
jgi:hypothetical protein